MPGYPNYPSVGSTQVLSVGIWAVLRVVGGLESGGDEVSSLRMRTKG